MPVHISKAKGSRATGTAKSAKRKTPVRGKSTATKMSASKGKGYAMSSTGRAKSATGRARAARKGR